MKEATVRELVLRTARGYLGLREGDEKHRELISLYNRREKLPRGYQMGENDPWCAAFVSAVGEKTGISHILLPECSVYEMARLYGGAEKKKDPRPGDLVIYDLKGDGRADHIGFVGLREGKEMRVLEGNYHDTVAYRSIRTTDPRILGYCYPQYHRLCREMDRITEVQLRLNLGYGAGLETDGKFGPKTKKALLTVLQKALGVTEDTFGERTVQALREKNLCRGSRGEMVEALQMLLNCHGWPVAVDGSFGGETYRYLRKYQKTAGLTPDGVAGSHTFRKLLA